MKKEININYPKYLKGPVEVKNKQINFYVVKSWVANNNTGANVKWINGLNMNYINTIEELPENSGIYITGYDANLEDLKIVKSKNIPIIDNTCPWIKNLKNNLYSVDKNKFQCVLLIDKGHLVYNCYKSIFPDDIIIIDANNYKEEFNKQKNNKPIYFLTYTTFRKKEVMTIIDFINDNYHHNENKLDSYKRTLCQWTSQGLFEEISQAVKNHNLAEIWVICNGENNRSTKSIINEILENKINPVIIKDINEIPEIKNKSKNIGVLIAPMPQHKDTSVIKDLIKKKIEKKLEIFKPA